MVILLSQVKPRHMVILQNIALGLKLSRFGEQLLYGGGGSVEAQGCVVPPVVHLAEIVESISEQVSSGFYTVPLWLHQQCSNVS